MTRTTADTPPTLQPHPAFGGDGRFIPAVGFCPGCGPRDQQMNDLTRRFHCPHCGLEHDDRRAAA